MKQALRESSAIDKLLKTTIPQNPVVTSSRKQYEPIEKHEPVKDSVLLNEKDTAISSQISAILRATLDKPITHVPFKNAITKEMVADYEEEQNQPIEINGQFYPYHPATIEVDLEAVPAYDPTDEEATHELIKKLTEHYDAIGEEIKNIDEAIPNLNKEYEDRLGKIFSGQSHRRSADIRSEIKIRVDTLKKDYEDLMESINERRIQFVKTQDNLMSRLQQVRAQLINVKDYQEGNIKEVVKRNQQKVKDFEENLKLMNTGKFNLTQDIGESPEDYLQRIRNVTAVLPDQSTQEERALLYESRKFKRNMKSLTPNVSTAESVLSILTQDDPALPYEANKIFPLILSEYTKRFGTSQVKDNDIALLIKKMLSSPTPEIIIPTAEVIDEEKRLKVLNTLMKDKLSETIGELFKHTGAFDTTIRGIPIKIKASRNGTPQVTMNNKQFNPTHAGNKVELTMIYVAMMEHLRGQNPDLYRQFNQKVNQETKDTYGAGLSLPKWCQFGKVELGLDKLYHQNIVSVRNPRSKLQVQGFKSAPVSDAFVEIIMKITRGENPDLKFLDKLNHNDRLILDTLLHVSGLQKIVPHTKDKTVEQYKKRLQLVEGEIEAGNTNEELKKELYQILHHLHFLGAISLEQARRHYRDMITF